MSPLPENLDVSFLLLAKKGEEVVNLNKVIFENLNAKAHVDATIFKDYPQTCHGGGLSTRFRRRLALLNEAPAKGGLDKEQDQGAFDQ